MISFIVVKQRTNRGMLIAVSYGDLDLATFTSNEIIGIVVKAVWTIERADAKQCIHIIQRAVTAQTGSDDGVPGWKTECARILCPIALNQAVR